MQLNEELFRRGSENNASFGSKFAFILKERGYNELNINEFKMVDVNFSCNDSMSKESQV